MGAFDESLNNFQRIDLCDFSIDEISIAMRKNELKTCSILPDHRLYLFNNGDVYGEMTAYMGPGFAYKGQVAAKPDSEAFLMNTASFFSKKPPIIYEPQTDSSYDFDV